MIHMTPMYSWIVCYAHGIAHLRTTLTHSAISAHHKSNYLIKLPFLQFSELQSFTAKVLRLKADIL